MTAERAVVRTFDPDRGRSQLFGVLVYLLGSRVWLYATYALNLGPKKLPVHAFRFLLLALLSLWLWRGSRVARVLLVLSGGIGVIVGAPLVLDAVREYGIMAVFDLGILLVGDAVSATMLALSRDIGAFLELQREGGSVDEEGSRP